MWLSARTFEGVLIKCNTVDRLDLTADGIRGRGISEGYLRLTVKEIQGYVAQRVANPSYHSCFDGDACPATL
jgi:hypothetical protein